MYTPRATNRAGMDTLNATTFHNANLLRLLPLVGPFGCSPQAAGTKNGECLAWNTGKSDTEDMDRAKDRSKDRNSREHVGTYAIQSQMSVIRLQIVLYLRLGYMHEDGLENGIQKGVANDNDEHSLVPYLLCQHEPRQCGDTAPLMEHNFNPPPKGASTMLVCASQANSRTIDYTSTKYKPQVVEKARTTNLATRKMQDPSSGGGLDVPK